jgi:Protein of unknown function (DUF418)
MVVMVPERRQCGSVLTHADWPPGWVGAFVCNLVHFATGCRNGSMRGLDRDPEGDPKSRLWVVGAGRGQGRPNGLARRRSFLSKQMM